MIVGLSRQDAGEHHYRMAWVGSTSIRPVKVAENTVDAARLSVEKLEQHFPPEAFEQPELRELRADLNHYVKLANRVLDQTRRRILDEESVPAVQKVVSIFEPRTDIASGLIVDCFVERGNPADSTKAVKLAERAIKVLGKTPEQIVLDGGFSSRDDLEEIKALGIRDVAFSKAPGLSIKEMVKRTWLYQRLSAARAEGECAGSAGAFGAEMPPIDRGNRIAARAGEPPRSARCRRGRVG
jgi:IS5 family transposase